jgi:hypothetical protein
VVGLGLDLGGLALAGPEALAEVVDDPAWEELLADRTERTVASFAAHPAVQAWGLDPAGLVTGPDGRRRVAGRALGAAVRRAAALDPGRAIVALDDLAPVVIPGTGDEHATDAEDPGTVRAPADPLSSRLIGSSPRLPEPEPVPARPGAVAPGLSRDGTVLRITADGTVVAIDLATGGAELCRSEAPGATLRVPPSLDVRSARVGTAGGLPVVRLTGIAGSPGAREAFAVAERWRVLPGGAVELTRAVPPGAVVPAPRTVRTGGGPRLEAGPAENVAGGGPARTWTVRWDR